MSVRRRPVARGRPRTRLVVPLLAVLALASLNGAAPALADRPPAQVLDPAAAFRAGLAVAVTRHPSPAGELLEVAAPHSDVAQELAVEERARRTAAGLLDVGADGSVVLADAVSDPGAGMTIRRPDGTLVRIALPGVAGARFAPDGSWLAAIDAAGRLWSVDPADGAATMLDPGPYGGMPAFDGTGRPLLVAVASVEAPYATRLVRLDPASHASQSLTDGAGIVFSATPLAGGEIAIVTHPIGGGVDVRIIGPTSERLLRELPGDATDVAVGADGETVAYAVAGDGIYLLAGGSSGARRIGDGSKPQLAPQGDAVLVVRDGGAALLDTRGAVLERFGSPAVAWSACPEGCRS